MDKFAKRILKRENGIKNWLKNNQLESLLQKADEILDNLPREEIKNDFEKGIKSALQHCIKNDSIKALDFEWYYAGRETGSALAYGFDHCLSKGTLSKSDLGPEELPGIELKLEHGNLIDESFAEIPTSNAINELVRKIKPIIKEHNNHVKDVITDYFQIWNYKIGYETCNLLKGSDIETALKNRSPFWVTMTRHERWSVPIMLID